MNMNINKFWPSAAASIIAGSCMLNASDEAQMRNIENRVASLECSQNSCCVINPSARPYATDCWGFYVTVDPIIWQAHVNGLGFAVTANDSSLNALNVKSRVQNLDFDWNWGIRVGVGLNTPHDGWDALLKWTYWKTDASKQVAVTENSGTFIFPRVGLPQSELNPFDIGSAKANWHMTYNMLDLENGRDFYISKCLTLRPHAGLRSAWIEQKFAVGYDRQVVSANFSSVNDLKDRFWGLGIRGGFDLQWGIGCGFSLFSNFAGSLMYGYHSITSSINQVRAADSATLSDLGVKDFYHVGTAIFDSQLGIRWDWVSCNECYHLGFDFGWEQHWHPGQNQFIFFTGNLMEGNYFANQGDLGTQGYFMRVRFDF